jgi:hypothetical protein
MVLFFLVVGFGFLLSGRCISAVASTFFLVVRVVNRGEKLAVKYKLGLIKSRFIRPGPIPFLVKAVKKSCKGSEEEQ